MYDISLITRNKWKQVETSGNQQADKRGHKQVETINHKISFDFREGFYITLNLTPKSKLQVIYT